MIKKEYNNAHPKNQRLFMCDFRYCSSLHSDPLLRPSADTEGSSRLRENMKYLVPRAQGKKHVPRVLSYEVEENTGSQVG